MLILENPDSFYSALEQGALALAPNHHLAVALHETWGELRKARDLPLICPSPDIRAVDVWTGNLWKTRVSRAAHPKASWQLLGSGHEQLLWLGIIQSSKAAESILNPEATARAASQAATLMQQFSFGAEQVQQWLKDEWRLQEDYLDLTHFLHWHREFQSIKSKQQLLTLTDVLSLVIALIEEGAVTLPEKIMLYGFSEPPPLYKDLFSAIAQHSTIETLSLKKLAPEISVLQCQSTIQEISSAARWANTLIRDNLHCKIGILCPDLSSRQHSINRIFSHHEHLREFADQGSRSLDQEPLIHSALALLDLNQENLGTLELCSILRSRWIAGADSEITQRAALEMHLRKYGELNTSTARLRELCHQTGRPHHCPDLSTRLQGFAGNTRANSRKQLTPAQCATVFTAQLQSLGWPGEQQLDKKELNTLEQWQHLLEQFLETTPFLPSLNLNEALSTLRNLASNSHSTQRSLAGIIQVLTPAEAEHLQFTHLWLMGVNEQLWPPAMQPNALLPFTLQQQLGLPNADRLQHFVWYQTLLHTLIGNSLDEVQLSYASTLDDLDARPASILQHLGKAHQCDESIPDTQLLPAFAQLRNSTNLGEAIDTALLPLHISEQPRGGASLMENQSACPFKALAIHRLGAEELPVPVYGLNYMALGTLLHMALEAVWQEIVEYKKLITLTAEERTELVTLCARQAISYTARQYPQLMQPRFRVVEERRLVTLLTRWLEIEEKREFTSVEEFEQSLEWTYKGFTLRLKVDRIDKQSDNSLTIIDYKSGRKLSVDWLDQRPAHPQLILYLLAVEQHYSTAIVSALFYAFVNIQESVFSGISDIESTYPGLHLDSIKKLKDSGADWNSLKQLWQTSIENIADEFLTGLHTVTPAKPALCKNCHVRPLCRIDEIRALAEEDEEQEAEF